MITKLLDTQMSVRDTFVCSGDALHIFSETTYLVLSDLSQSRSMQQKMSALSIHQCRSQNQDSDWHEALVAPELSTCAASAPQEQVVHNSWPFAQLLPLQDSQELTAPIR